MKSSATARGCVATFVFAAFLWILLLGASPELHARIHADANGAEHICAVTLISAGSYEHAPQPLVNLPLPVFQFRKIPTLTPQWVASPFLGASIFEHAPPARD